MLNMETPRLKFALYGAHSSLGSALLCELMARQHESIAVLDDLNSLAARPGLRVKLGTLYEPQSVVESVAGVDGVVCLFDAPGLPQASDAPHDGARHYFYAAVDSLLVGLPRVQVKRLLLVADFTVLDQQPEVEAALQRLAAHPLEWTLVSAPAPGYGLDIDDVMSVDSEDIRQLRRVAAALCDELETPRHRHAQMNLRL